MLSAWPGSGTSASSSSGSHLSLFARTILSALGKPQTDSTSVSAVKKPNIIFFIIDDLGLGDIDLDGASSPESITPTLAQLSQSGISLQRYYSLPICTPARASFLTGKYPLRLGMQHSVIEAAGERETTTPPHRQAGGHGVIGEEEIVMCASCSLATSRGAEP